MEPDAPGRERRPLGRFGRFTILRVIGQGASGSVFEVHDPQLDRRAALKVLRDVAGNGSAARVERFVREGEALARLRHPHVVAVHEAGSSGGIPYVLLELVEGDTLDRVAQAGAAPDLLIAHVVQIARGLEAVHRAGILHRDVKPQNIIVDGARGARLVDFGLARLAEATSLTATGAFVGTPAYVAPEAMTRAEVGPAADIYGLGATLFDVLTGCPPLTTGSTAPDPRAHAPSVSPQVAAVCRRALAPDPAARWPTAGAFADALEVAAAAPPERRIPRALVAGAAALAALALLIAGARSGPTATTPMTPTATTATATEAVDEPPPPRREVEVDEPPPIIDPWALVTSTLFEPAAGRHAGGTWCAAVTSGAPHGALVLSGGGDGLVRVWRGADGALLRTIEVTGARGAPVQALAAAADGRTLVAFAGAQVSRWTLEEGERLDTWTLPGVDPRPREAGQPPDLRLSADGERALALVEGRAHVLEPGAPPRALTDLTIMSIALSPDGHLAALGDRAGKVLVHDLAGEAPARLLEVASRGAVSAVAFDPAGRDLAAATNAGRLVVFEGASRAPKRVAGAKQGLRTLVHLGRRLLAAASLQPLATFERRPNGAWRAGRDGALTNGHIEVDAGATSFAAVLPGRLRVVWRDLATGADRWPAGLPGAADALLPAAGGMVVASGGRLLRLPDQAGAEPRDLGRFEGNVFGPAQVAGGRALLTQRRGPDETWTELFDLSLGSTLGRWDLANPPRCALAPDGASVACVDTAGRLVINAPGEAPRRPDVAREMSDAEYVRTVDVRFVRWIEADALLLARTNALQVWSVATGRLISSHDVGMLPEIDDLALGREAVVIAGGAGPVVLVREGAAPALLEGSADAGRLAIDPGGAWVVTAGARTAIVWDLRRPAPARVGRLEAGADDAFTAVAATGSREFVLGTERGAVLRVRLVE